MAAEVFTELMSLLVVAASAAAIGQFLTGYSRGGCPVSFLFACIGGYLGPRVAEWRGWEEPLLVPLGPVQFPVVTTAAGALILVVLVNMVTRRRKF